MRWIARRFGSCARPGDICRNIERRRARAGDFLTLCKTPELACEVTLQPLRRFALDAAILFSDILTIPDAMGLGLTMEEGVGPRFDRPLRSHRDIEALPPICAAAELRYVMEAIRLARHELAGQAPLIGFSGSPWTLAAYMVEVAAAVIFAAPRVYCTNSRAARTYCWGKSPPP